jgi:hypothetical protein
MQHHAALIGQLADEADKPGALANGSNWGEVVLVNIAVAFLRAMCWLNGDRFGGLLFDIFNSSVCRRSGQQKSINGPPQKRLSTTNAHVLCNFPERFPLLRQEER